MADDNVARSTDISKVFAEGAMTTSTGSSSRGFLNVLYEYIRNGLIIAVVGTAVFMNRQYFTEDIRGNAMAGAAIAIIFISIVLILNINYFLS